ncbi:unnamed protein product [Allacma fusca]|uniref:Uncharacterized protein n=1 Tax=Allacma fusca TaxID=39272 RepID=A0A8J2L2G5_9HEXA|nr:unnamed protein product [Allacma fusca]
MYTPGVTSCTFDCLGVPKKTFAARLVPVVPYCSECVVACYWTVDGSGKCSCLTALEQAESDLVGFLRRGSVCEGFVETYCHVERSFANPLLQANQGAFGIRSIMSLVLRITLMVTSVLVWFQPERSGRVRRYIIRHLQALLRRVRENRMVPARSSSNGNQVLLRPCVPPPQLPAPPTAPPRSHRSRSTRQEPTPVQVPILPNPPDFHLDQSLEQQRLIVLRFWDFKSGNQRLISRMNWLQNRLLELQKPLHPSPPPLRLALSHLHPFPPPLRPFLPTLRPAPSPEPSPSHHHLRQEQLQELLTDDEDEVLPSRSTMLFGNKDSYVLSL